MTLFTIVLETSGLQNYGRAGEEEEERTKLCMIAIQLHLQIHHKFCVLELYISMFS